MYSHSETPQASKPLSLYLEDSTVYYQIGSKEAPPAHSLHDPRLPVGPEEDLPTPENFHLELVPLSSCSEPEPVVLRVPTILSKVPNGEVNLLYCKFTFTLHMLERPERPHLNWMFLTVLVINVSQLQEGEGSCGNTEKMLSLPELPGWLTTPRKPLVPS